MTLTLTSLEVDELMTLTLTGLEEGDDLMTLTLTGLEEGDDLMPLTLTGLEEVDELMTLTLTGLEEVDELMTLTLTGLEEVDDLMPLTLTGLEEVDEDAEAAAVVERELLGFVDLVEDVHYALSVSLAFLKHLSSVCFLIGCLTGKLDFSDVSYIKIR